MKGLQIALYGFREDLIYLHATGDRMTQDRMIR